MPHLLESLLAAALWIPLLLSFLLPLRFGITGAKFWQAVVFGWALTILACFLWDWLMPASNGPYPSKMVLLWIGVIIGWLPAFGLYLTGRLTRRIFRLHGKTIGWGRFATVLIILLVVLWWPGTRTLYFVRMSLFDTLSGRQTNFAELPNVLPPASATLIHVYRGLPHQSDSDKLWRDLFTTSNRGIAGYRFYSQPAVLPEPLRKSLSTLLQSPSLYQPYGGPKLCGGYHPDYCFEWQSAEGPFHGLLCSGCGEMRLVGRGATVHCDLAEDTAAVELEKLLKSLTP